MNKYFISLAIIFFGICMVVSSLYISDSLKKIAFNQKEHNTTIEEKSNEWEVIVVNDNNVILFNHYSGEYWTKFIENDEGSSEWKKGVLPSD